jgi:hypothetical protein
MPRNNSIIGSIVGLIIFLGFGVFFLFGWGSFEIFSFFPIFPMIFVVAIFGIVVAASANSRRSTVSSSWKNDHYQSYSQEVPRSNPYVAKTSVNSIVRPIYIEDAEPEIPTANFCQYCGTKKDRNAKYCYNCGTKLQ